MTEDIFELLSTEQLEAIKRTHPIDKSLHKRIDRILEKRKSKNGEQKRD